MRHTFVISAYQDSPYLESCIRSLIGQSVKSDIILCTSTPSEFIRMMAEKYDLPVYIREAGETEQGIGYDWNFAYSMADTELVTIAHQDDIYHHDYTKVLLETKEKYPDMSLFTTASVSIRNGKLVEYGGIEIIKKLLRTPLRIPAMNDHPWVKKAAITLGNPVICPSCTYDKTVCGDKIFDENLHFVLDWDALCSLAEKKGRWICIEKPLIMYRVHTDSATGEAIHSSLRESEEAEMFDRLLPKPAADVIKKLYKKSYVAYK